MYKKLSDLPVAIHETNLETLRPQKKIIELLENTERQTNYADQSLSLIDNIKRAVEIWSDGRIVFNS
jgi:hypothetical protein